MTKQIIEKSMGVGQAAHQITIRLSHLKKLVKPTKKVVQAG